MESKFVTTDKIKEAVAGREEAVLTALGIDWERGRPHIRCPYPNHEDKDPSWRWEGSKSCAFCSCTDKADDILSIIRKVKNMDFDGAKLFAAEAIDKTSLIRTKRPQSNPLPPPPPPPPQSAPPPPHRPRPPPLAVREPYEGGACGQHGPSPPGRPDPRRRRKRTGWDRGRYARGSTALYGSVRAQINIGVGGPDVDDALIIACGKNNNGRMFSKRAVRLDEHSKRYLVDPDFDWDAYKQSMRPPDKQRASAKEPKTTAATATKKGAGRPSKQESIPDSSVLSLVKEIGQTSLVDAAEELSEIYDVSRKTAQRRIEMLADTGLINIDPADGILAARFLTRSEEVSLEL